MTVAYYVSHPQVVQDPSVAVPRWTLSDVGRRRLSCLRKAEWATSVQAVWSSGEQKAVDTAWFIAGFARCPLMIDQRMHENDRSATGYLAPLDFEAVADAFFANPERSVRGWETAIDAQARIVRAVDEALSVHTAGVGGPLALCGHGGVGTLLYCHLAREPIKRVLDQPAGGGNVFAFDIATREPVFSWMPLEAVR